MSPTAQTQEQLNKIYAPVKSELKKVNQLITDTLTETRAAHLLEINRHLLAAPGKRLRPILTLLSYQALAKPDSDLEGALNLAAAVELIHMASLVHDDVIDTAPIRHNQPTIYAKWGTNISITMGIYLYSLALKRLAVTGNIDILTQISRTVEAMCEGELHQIFERENTQLTLEDYVSILEKKTGVLFGSACYGGAKLAGADSKTAGTMAQFGQLLGIVFQMIDDYMDLKGNAAELGKVPGQDLLKGEITLPLLLCLQSLPPHEAQQFNALIAAKDAKKLPEIWETIHHTGTMAKTKTIILDYLQKAQEKLDRLPSNEATQNLRELTQFIADRAFS